MTTSLEVAIARLEERQRSHEDVCEERQLDIKKAIETINTRISSLRTDLRSDRKVDMDALQQALKESNTGWRGWIDRVGGWVLTASVGVNVWLLVRFVIPGGS
jgi:hypothetical protein